MLQELVCHHLSKGTKRYLSLSRSVYRLGKALDNDIVLLDVNISPYLASLEKKNGAYTWVYQQQEIDAEKNKFEVGDYVFSVKNHKAWMRLALFMVMFLVSLVLLEQIQFKKRISSSAVSLPAKGTFGNLDPKQPINAVKFEFQPNAERYSVLHYTPGNLEGDQDLEIQINGKFLVFAPASAGKWNVEQSQLLPTDTLVQKSNTVEFIYRGQKLNTWGIRDIYVEGLDEKPEIQDAKALIKNAQKLFRERNVRAGNLVRAEQLIRQAGQYYYAKHEPYPLVLEKLAQKIKKEKMDMINDHQMLIQKYKEQGDMRRASLMYRKLMNELIDPVDPDRNKILRESGSV